MQATLLLPTRERAWIPPWSLLAAQLSHGISWALLLLAPPGLAWVHLVALGFLSLPALGILVHVLKGFLDRLFKGDSVEAILAALDREAQSTGADAAWAQKTAATMRTKSPTSLKLALAQVRRGAGFDFATCMRAEFRIVSRIIHDQDFYEGVRAVIVDKDNSPRWSPASLEAVSAAEVATLSLRAIGARHMGETTRGALSDALVKYLPNGDRITLSNEVYTDSDGIAWEGRGIAPQVPRPNLLTDDPLASHLALVNEAAAWLRSATPRRM